MTTRSDTLRKYLIGQLAEDDCEALEREYFASESTLDRLAAAEDDLIEQYLLGGLKPTERDLFERGYLSAPHHRRRVEIVRSLMKRSSFAPESAGAAPASRSGAWTRWLSAAAIVVAVAGGALWSVHNVGRRRLAPRGPDIAAGANGQPSPPPERRSQAEPTQDRVVAITLSPVTLRSADEHEPPSVPEGTRSIELRLEGERTAAARAAIRTVDGAVVWEGAAEPSPGGTELAARVVVPAAVVPPNDYIVVLTEADASGTARERSRYVLRIRRPHGPGR